MRRNRPLLNVCLCAASLLGAAQALPAWAQSQDSAPSLHWTCIQHRDPLFTVACAAHATGDIAETSASADDSRLPFAPRDLRPVAARGTREALSARSWHIPLMAPPSDAHRVATLLDAVLCGSVAGCDVEYRGEASIPR